MVVGVGGGGWGGGHGILFSSCPSVCPSVVFWFLSGVITNKHCLLTFLVSFNL